MVGLSSLLVLPGQAQTYGGQTYSDQTQRDQTASAPETGTWTRVDPAKTGDGEFVELPLWELGVGGFGGWTPDYPASEEGQPVGLGAPFLIYRGDLFRFGDGAIASVVPVETKKIKFGLSFDAAFNSDSDDNDARRGMPDLDFLFGVGPELEINLMERKYTPEDTARVDLALQVRAVASTDFSDLESRGFVVQPRLRWERRNPWNSGVNAFASVGPIWATEDLHEYFYEVPANFTTADRAQYDAESGYLGTELFVGFGADLTDRVRWFMGSQVGYYGGAANEDSPLFTSDVTVSAFVGFAWSFWRSDTTVKRPRGRAR